MERKAAIYLRVSTTDQNYERQRDELEATVKYEGYRLVKVYEEKKSAVLDMDTREELTKMRQLSKADVDAIFFWDVTRLSRKSIDFITLVEEFSNKGICLHFKNERLTTLQDNGEMHPMAKLQLYILGVFAQMDAENLKAKFKSGKERSLAIGNAYTANAPYGYKLENKKLYINEKEATIVRTFFDWYLEGKPLREIESLLNSKNIPTRKGELWSKAMIIKMIKNPVYKGEPIYKNRNKDGEVIKERTFNAPIIIEPAKWELAQIQKEKNKTYADKGRTRKALLRGLLVCGNCEKPYNVVLTGAGFINYACSDNRASINTKVGCTNGGISAGYLDYICWETIKGIYLYQNFRQKFQEEKAKNIALLDENNAQIKNYIDNISKLEKQKDRVREGYRKGIYDDVSAAKDISILTMEIEQNKSFIKKIDGENELLKNKINQSLEHYKIVDKQPIYEEKLAIVKDLIEIIRIYSYGMYKRTIKLDLKMGLSFNILYNSNHAISSYVVIDDNIATFNKKNIGILPNSLADRISDFTVTSDNNEMFGEEVFGGYSFDELWNICKSYKLLKPLPELKEEDKYKQK